MIKHLAVVVGVIMFATSANALTLKSGQVLASDGKVYDHCSPKQCANLIKKGESSGVHGKSVYINVSGELHWFEFKDLRGKSKKDLKEYITLNIVANITGVDYDHLHTEVNRDENKDSDVLDVVREVAVAEAIADLDVDVDEVMNAIENDLSDVDDQVAEAVNEAEKVLQEIDQLVHNFVNKSENLSDKVLDNAISEAVELGAGDHIIDGLLVKVTETHYGHRVTLYEQVNPGEWEGVADLGVKNQD